MIRRTFFALTAATAFALLTAAALLGCGPSGPRTYPVSGTVTFEGKPVNAK